MDKWTATKMDDGTYWIRGADNRTVCERVCNEADAKMIENAPDLLDTLVYVQCRLSGIVEGLNMWNDMISEEDLAVLYRILNRVDDAITKARGE
jgi:hypothetical protein